MEKVKTEFEINKNNIEAKQKNKMTKLQVNTNKMGFEEKMHEKNM